jgi:hypothetical protein
MEVWHDRADPDVVLGDITLISLAVSCTCCIGCLAIGQVKSGLFPVTSPLSRAHCRRSNTQVLARPIQAALEALPMLHAAEHYINEEWEP